MSSLRAKPVLAARFTIGAVEVAALSDGVGQQQPDDWFPGVPTADWMRAVGSSNVTETLPVNFGSFLVRGSDRTVLIDTGNGPRTRGQHPGAAGLLERMAEVDIRPEDVDAVLLTHFHGDHVGWNTDQSEGGSLTFPNASFWLHEADVRYLDRPGAETRPGDRFSRSKIQPVRDLGRLQVFEGEHSPFRGFTFLPTPGHTPGHCAILIESQGEHLIVVGDAAPHVAHLEHSDWTPVFDLDTRTASKSRRLLAERAIRIGALVTGGHFAILTVGRLHRAEEGYRWEDVEVQDPH